MSFEALHGMLDNAALLLLFSIFYVLIPLRASASGIWVRLGSGLVVGGIGIALMVTAWRFEPGIVFDTRSILLTHTGLFFGTLPSGVATALMAGYRAWLGGVGAVTGVGVIVSSAVLGIFWRLRFPHRRGWLDFYALGLVVHVVMLAWMLAMPWETALATLQAITAPVLLVCPVATMLVGRLMQSQKEQRTAAEEKETNARRLERMLEGSWGILSLLDEKMNPIYVSPSFTAVLGYPREEYMTLPPESLVHPDDRIRLQQALAEVGAHPGASRTLLVRARRRSGEWAWLELQSTNLLHDPHLAAVIVHARDVTQAKEQQELLEKEGRRLATVLTATGAGTWDWDIPSGKVFYDERWAELLGYTLEELGPGTVETWERLTHPDDLRHAWSELEKHFAGGNELYEEEFRMRHKEGHWVWIQSRGRVVERTPDGQPVRMFGTHIDISARKNSEATERLFTTAIDHARNEIYVFDADTLRFVHCNRAARENLMYSMEELRSKSPLELKSELSREEFEQILHPLRVGEKDSLRFETTHARKDGSRYPVEVYLSYHGPSRHFVAIVNDITDLRRREEEKGRLEAQLRQSQKLEAVGRLAGGIAHDFNNMLSVILGAAELAMADVEPDSHLQKVLQEIISAAQRSAQLTRQLLAFSRKQWIRPQLLNLNDWITDHERMFRRLLGEDVEIHLELRDNLWPVFLDPSQADQILVNLLLNARDAIEGVGKIVIRTDNTRLDGSCLGEESPVTAGDHVLLEVSDTGTGMTPEVLEHIFEPFFTTKEVGKGTGLGLATVYGIVRQNGGCVRVYSEPGMGSVFKIYLPRHLGTQAGPAKEESRGKPIEGTETLLLVEDQEEVLELAARFLRSAGYHVLTAGTPSEALEIARRHVGALDLLVSDLIMPEMNGRKLQEELHKIQPDVPTLFISGYSSEILAHRGVLDHEVLYLQKPFTPKTLAEKIREILDSRR